jgi:MFS family permease
VINRLMFLIAAFNLAGFLVFFLQERFPAMGTEEVAKPAASIIMFVGIFILISAVPSGWLSDRFGKKPLLVISGLLASFGAALVVTAPDLNLIKVGGCFIGAGAGFFYSVNWALGTSIVPVAKAGQYLGVSNLAGAGAGAIGAYIGGPIADNQSFVLLMGIYGGLFLLSLLPLLKIQEKVPERI